jgi:hypothetical protein
MIVHGIIFAVVGPFFVVTGIILPEPLVIAFGAVTSALAAWIIGDEAKWWRKSLGRSPPGRRRELNHWPLLLAAGLVALSVVVVVTKANQGLLRPGDVWLLGGWLVISTVLAAWHLRRFRRKEGSSGT